MIQMGCFAWLLMCGIFAIPFQALGMSTNAAFGAGVVLASLVTVLMEALLSSRSPQR